MLIRVCTKLKGGQQEGTSPMKPWNLDARAVYALCGAFAPFYAACEPLQPLPQSSSSYYQSLLMQACHGLSPVKTQLLCHSLRCVLFSRIQTDLTVRAWLCKEFDLDLSPDTAEGHTVPSRWFYHEEKLRQAAESAEPHRSLVAKIKEEIKLYKAVHGRELAACARNPRQACSVAVGGTTSTDGCGPESASVMELEAMKEELRAAQQKWASCPECRKYDEFRELNDRIGINLESGGVVVLQQQGGAAPSVPTIHYTSLTHMEQRITHGEERRGRLGSADGKDMEKRALPAALPHIGRLLFQMYSKDSLGGISTEEEAVEWLQRCVGLQLTDAEYETVVNDPQYDSYRSAVFSADERAHHKKRKGKRCVNEEDASEAISEVGTERATVSSSNNISSVQSSAATQGRSGDDQDERFLAFLFNCRYVVHRPMWSLVTGVGVCATFMYIPKYACELDAVVVDVAAQDPKLRVPLICEVKFHPCDIVIARKQRHRFATLVRRKDILRLDCRISRIAIGPVTVAPSPCVVQQLGLSGSDIFHQFALHEHAHFAFIVSRELPPGNLPVPSHLVHIAVRAVARAWSVNALPSLQGSAVCVVDGHPVSAHEEGTYEDAEYEAAVSNFLQLPPQEALTEATNFSRVTSELAAEWAKQQQQQPFPAMTEKAEEIGGSNVDSSQVSPPLVPPSAVIDELHALGLTDRIVLV